MSKIRIYSKKAFAIGPGAQRGNPEIELFNTVPNSFQDMPEAYKDDPTFKLAVSVGDITIVNSTPVIGNSGAPVIDTSKFDDEPIVDKDKLIEEFYEKVKAMNSEEVYEQCTKYNAEFIKDEKLKENKKRLMEAYKLSLDSDN